MGAQLFTGLCGVADWSATDYRATAGLFGGATIFQASALFMPLYGGVPGAIGGNQQIWGNLDAPAFKGWAIGITAAGLIYAKRCDGSIVSTITFDPLGRLLRRWCLATLFATSTAFALYINGAIEASASGLSALVPGVGQAVVGGTAVLGAGEFQGLIAGVAYSPSAAVDPYTQAADVARTGQISIVSGVSAPAAPANSWQVQGYNEAAGASWQPATGSTVLTRTGSDSALLAQNAPANMWL